MGQSGVPGLRRPGEHGALSPVGAAATTAGFSWNIQCSPGFTLFHRLEFLWSSVELSLQNYFVCEDQGTVSLDIIRKGNLAESSYVTIKVSFSGLSSPGWDGAEGRVGGLP